MKRHSLGALYLLLGLSLAMVAVRVDGANGQAKETKDAISPEFDRCTVDVDGHTVKAVRTSSPKLPEHAAKNLRITVDGGTVVAVKLGEEKPLWTAKALGETRLVWLAADEKIIYLSGYKVPKKFEGPRPEAPLRVRRLELDSGKWLDDLAVGGKPGPKRTESILGARTRDTRVVVVTVTTDDGWDWTRRLISYRVSCFQVGETRPLWSKTFASAVKVALPGAFVLWGEGRPAVVEPDVQPLTFLGEDVLVCAGPFQDLLCLEGSTGKQRWRTERVGEYERGFIGPSGLQRTFGRSIPLPAEPLDEGDEKKDEKPEKDEKTPPSRQHSIVGGPIVVDVPTVRSDDCGRRILVAVAKATTTFFSEYVSNYVIYELNSEGQPLAMVDLPRMVRARQYQVQKDGVVWACQGGAFVKVAVSAPKNHMDLLGARGRDLLCRLAWYRHLWPEEPKAWLTAMPAGDPLAFGNEYAFRVCAGGYVTEPDAGAYHFPLSIIDLKTGADRTLVLRVPYKGKLPEPETSYTRWRSAQGKDRWQTFGPYVLAVTQLQVEGRLLRVTLGMDNFLTSDRVEKRARSVEFPIDELCSR
jgi:hypothetical protein